MKKSPVAYSIAIAVVVVLVVLAGLNLRTRQLEAATVKAEAEQKAVMASLFSDVRRTLGDFHADVMALTPSANGVAGLENEMHRLKGAATRRLEQMHEVQAKVAKLPSTQVTDYLVEATEKSVKYLEGSLSWANLETDEATMRARSAVMNDALESFRTKAGLTGSPDKGDTAGEVSRISNVAARLVAARKQAGIAAAAEAARKARGDGADSEDDYWRNAEYSGYRRQTRSIVQRYAAGRTILSAVLSHYDSGSYSDRDRTNLLDQYGLRQGLLQEIDRLSGTLPPGSVYSVHHDELRQMLTDACDAMERFANYPTAATRSNLSAVSSRNSELLGRLKRFYSVD